MPMIEQLVSIIIPTYNSASTIDMCLRSIKNQTYKNIEIIVVDNFSKDDTIEIANMHGVKIIESNSTRTNARNIAEKESKGEFIFSIDSDMELTEKVVEECIQMSEELDSVIVPEISFGIGFWTKCRVIERMCYVGDDTMEAARFFKRRVFDIVNGYDPSLEFGEDWDIHQRIKNMGFKIGRIESFIRHNEGNLNLRRIVKKKYRYGKTLDRYKRKHPQDFSEQSKFVRPAFIKNWKFLARSHIIGLGILFMKFCEFGAMYLGYMSSRLIKNNMSENYIPNTDQLPFVSFIIPTYNAENYIGNCLDSIAMQNYPRDRIEILVIDGGSNDDTLKIVRKYDVKILDNPKRDAESGKFIGISQSKGEVMALVDSDNEIAHVDWLIKMVVPLICDKDIIGVESQYLIKDDFSMLNRYCTRIKIIDPLARLLASAPHVENKGIYSTLNYKRNDNPVIGANGFLWRKNVISYVNSDDSRFDEANFASIATRKGFTKFAKIPGEGIYHYYSNNINDFIKKRIKIANKYKRRHKYNKNSWLNDISNIRFILAVLYCSTIIGPTLEASYQFIKSRDVSWLLHPIMSLVTILVYGKVYIVDRLGDLNGR